MKRLISFVLLFAFLICASASLTSCNGFGGGIKVFFEDDDFYDDVGNVLFSVFAGNNSFVPLINDKNLDLKSTLEISDYAVNNQIIENGKLNLDFSVLLTEQLNYDYTISLKAFEQMDVFKHCIQNDNEMLIDYGSVLNNKPLCFYDEGYNCFSDALEKIRGCIKEANFLNGEENYSLNGVEFKTNTISFTLNSNVLTKWIEDLTNRLFSANSTQDGIEDLKDNLVYSEWYYPVSEIAGLFKNEKLHLTWVRYFTDGDVCREKFSIHDPNNHHITLDVAYAEKDDKEYVEISVNAKDGGSDFDVFSMSVTKENKGSEFNTTAKILIGDELYITTRNNGNDKKALGVANINLMNVIGEQSFNVNFSYSGERVGEDNKNGIGLKQIIAFNIESFPLIGTDDIISFDAKVDLYADVTSEAPKVDTYENFYDLALLKDIYYYHSVGQLDFDNALEAIKRCLAGEKAEYYKPTTVVDPYKMDLEFYNDDEYDTAGKLGKKYIDILTSDNYTFKYSYHSNEVGYPINYSSEYIADNKKMYTFDYANGEDYIQYHEDTTVYEVRHEIKKILFSEYDSDTYNSTYGKTEYIYADSGYCDYENKRYSYELYYDYYVNKYYFIFDSNNNLKMILLVSSVDDSTQYMFIEELVKGTTPEDFVLPDYQIVDMLDYIE